MSTGLSVIVPVNDNNVAHLGPLLDSLWTQTQPPDEVLVIADAIQLHPATASFIAGARIISLSLRFGAPACWNIGVEQAKNDWVLLVEPGVTLDNDVVAVAIRSVLRDADWRTTVYSLQDVAVLTTRTKFLTVNGFPITAVCHSNPFVTLPLGKTLAVDIRRVR